jgi:complex iron-sulfur molybdoenzyme family reductase subunit alpha
VDANTKRFIRRSDIEHAHDEKTHHLYEDEFYCWNLKSGKPELMPGTEGSERKTIMLKDKGWDIDPALEGEWEMTLQGGKKVKVTTVFELLKKEASKYSAKDTQKITGVHLDVVTELATHIAKDKCVEITTGFSLNKYFNGVLSIWNIATICGLTGRFGPRGGLNTENEFQLSGLEALSGFAGKYSPRFASGFLSEFMMGNGMKVFDEYFAESDVKRATGIDKKEYKAIIGKMIEEGKQATKTAKSSDGGRGKPFWIPEVAILCADSRFRRNKADEYRKEFLKNVKYFTYIDYRMSEAAVYADLLLPAKSHYEVWDLRSSPGYHRFTNLAQPMQNMKPVGEAKDEWSMMSLIAQKLEEIAKKGPVQKVADPGFTKNGFRELDKFYQEYTNHDEESEANQEPYLGTDKDALEAALKSCPQYEPYTIEKMYAMGGFLTLNPKAAKSSPLYPNKPYNTWENQLYKFERFETLTGRQCCYVDMPLWIELGCATNTARDNIRPDNKQFPFALLTPHARWSIHTNYKNSKTLQRLQRGMPYVAINKEVAGVKNIKDGDLIRIYNQLGEFQANAKVSSSVAPDNIVMEDGWEPYWFKSLKGYNTVVPNSLNLLEMSGGWGHLKFGGNWDGNQYAYDGAINFEKVKA